MQGPLKWIPRDGTLLSTLCQSIFVVIVAGLRVFTPPNIRIPHKVEPPTRAEKSISCQRMVDILTPRFLRILTRADEALFLSARLFSSPAFHPTVVNKPWKLTK